MEFIRVQYRTVPYRYFAKIPKNLKVTLFPHRTINRYITVKIMMLYRFRPVTDCQLPIVHHRATPVPQRPPPSLTTLTVTSRTVGSGKGREFHDDGPSITMGNDDLKTVMGRDGYGTNHNFYSRF